MTWEYVYTETEVEEDSLHRQVENLVNAKKKTEVDREKLTQDVEKLMYQGEQLVEGRGKDEVKIEKLTEQVEKLLQQGEQLVDDKKKAEINREKMNQQIEKLLEQGKKLVDDKKKADIDVEKMNQQVKKLMEQGDKLVEGKKKAEAYNEKLTQLVKNLTEDKIKAAANTEKLAEQVEELCEGKKWGDKVCLIKSVRSGKYLHLQGGSEVRWNGTNVNASTLCGPILSRFKWKFVSAYGSKIGIQNMKCYKYLNVAGGGLRNGTNVQVHGNSPMDSSTHNLWKITKVKGSVDHFNIRSVHNKRFLNLCDGGLENGTNVHTWEKTTDLNSVWKIIETN